MRHFLAIILGVLSAFMGVLIHRPDEDNDLRNLQIGLNELSWFPALLGGLAMWLGFTGKRRSWLAILAGLVGALASAKPFLEFQAASEDMDSAMRAGLGKDYESRIPQALQSRLPASRWSFANAIGGRERESQAQVSKNVVYAVTDGIPLKMDIYQPLGEPAIGNSYPAVVVIQGGSWLHTDDLHWFEPHSRYLASQGYVVFDVQHRLSPVAKWPAQLEDVQCAIRWVKNHAADFQLDAGRMALLGRSSGAHLALMAGIRAQDVGTRVQAIVSI